ncbi:MAG: antibiotic biosynthesis monooxygenase [Paracoccaceae bacterium]
MTTVRLNGKLLCRNAEEARIVARYLPEHIRLSREEPGCLHFDVAPLPDAPLVWTVSESFVDAAAFEAHQTRTRESRWYRATSAITREFVVNGL